MAAKNQCASDVRNILTCQLARKPRGVMEQNLTSKKNEKSDTVFDNHGAKKPEAAVLHASFQRKGLIFTYILN